MKGLLFWIAWALGLVALALAQPEGKPTPNRPTTQPQREGRVTVQDRERLQRYDKPDDKPRGDRPPERRDHRWHWHPHYHRWVLLPQATFKTDLVVLPPTYQLPQQVIYYDDEDGCLCPHCGKRVRLVP